MDFAKQERGCGKSMRRLLRPPWNYQRAILDFIVGVRASQA